MNQDERSKALQIITDRFGRDTLLSLATVEGSTPSVRIVDGYYANGSFYTITYALSGKMKQMESNPSVAVCGEWFTAHGIAQSLGWIRKEDNRELAATLREAFASWYSNGHVNESDPNTIILQIRLTSGVLFSNGTRYDIDFSAL